MAIPINVRRKKIDESKENGEEEDAKPIKGMRGTLLGHAKKLEQKSEIERIRQRGD